MTYDQFVAKISDEAYEDAKTGNDRREQYRSSYIDLSPKDEVLTGMEYAMYQESVYEMYIRAYNHAIAKMNDNTGKILGKIDLSKIRKG